MRAGARRLLAGALLAALPLLSGCVAAAIPVLAAGGVLGTQVDGKDAKPVNRGQPRVSIDTSRPLPAPGSTDPDLATATPSPPPAMYTRSVTLADGTRMEVMAGPLAPPSAAPTQTVAPASVQTVPVAANVTAIAHPVAAQPADQPLVTAAAQPAFPASRTLDDGTRVQIVAGALPPPSGAGMPPTGFAGYGDFYGYSQRVGTLPIAGSERLSAMLADPGTLAPTTRECSVHPAAVLIDLDPGAGVLDPAKAIHADPKLVEALAGLRTEGVTIAWISANTADRAGAVRRALIASGLDTVGRDELALLRYPEERKQTRREDFAREYCVVAIAGDERGDFDELFQYLKDPAVAAPLEPLIGNGWFLIPQPLS
jgi:hypothetical protein